MTSHETPPPTRTYDGEWFMVVVLWLLAAVGALGALMVGLDASEGAEREFGSGRLGRDWNEMWMWVGVAVVHFVTLGAFPTLITLVRDIAVEVNRAARVAADRERESDRPSL